MHVLSVPALIPNLPDDINHEKRLMSAAILRRLELEDWDKQRMKHHMLAKNGGGKW